MNKPGTIITVLTMGLIMLALTAIGQENYEIRSVAEAAATEDGTWVTVQGNITEKLRDNYFLLIDETGQIELKIRGDEWGQYSYDPTRKAQVYGKIITEDGVAKIEAKKVMYLD
ncbi:MAG: NirD/YgiW/YdeI family stress tolerance protein [Planctomycetes bacterium]|nr:NirD/YgiW/YdeI family stress tolerance protein [Planctomycetota bacterium]